MGRKSTLADGTVIWVPPLREHADRFIHAGCQTRQLDFNRLKLIGMPDLPLATLAFPANRLSSPKSRFASSLSALEWTTYLLMSSRSSEPSAFKTLSTVTLGERT